MKKVIHLMSTNAFSGAENVACQIINGNNSNEFDMLYVSEIKSNKESLNSNKIKYYDLKKFNFLNVYKAIKKIKPDIIHAHDIKASIIAAFFCKKIKIISHVHANHENMRKRNIKTILYNLFSKCFSSVIWISKSALDGYYFKSKIIDKSKIIYNAVSNVDINRKIELDSKQYNYDIIYLGRLAEQKDPLRIIDVINGVVSYKKDLKAVMVGCGELYDECKAKIAELNLSENIEMLGFIQNPYKILKSSKIFLLTSRYEGTPMCALEAISLGKPIVSTPTDGMNELVIDGKTGFLSADNNVLVEKICYLLENEERYNNFVADIIKYSDSINNIEMYMKNILELYVSEE